MRRRGRLGLLVEAAGGRLLTRVRQIRRSAVYGRCSGSHSLAVVASGAFAACIAVPVFLSFLYGRLRHTFRAVPPL